MRKRNIITAIFLVIVVVSGIAYYNYKQQPDGLTIESRELIMAEHKNPPRGQNWKIANEINFDNCIISAIYGSDGQIGIAKFEKQGNRYKLKSTAYRQDNKVIISNTMINNKMYDFAWFNGAQTEYAEIIYTTSDGTETIKHDSRNMDMFYHISPTEDYTLSVVYYDNEGNKYE